MWPPVWPQAWAGTVTAHERPHLAEGERGGHDPNEDVQGILHQLVLLHQDGPRGLQEAPAEHLQLPLAEPAEPVEGVPSCLSEVGLFSVSWGAVGDRATDALATRTRQEDVIRNNKTSKKYR